MKKRLVLIFLLICSCGLFFACASEQKIKTLEIPSGLEVENQYISFNEVENASYYEINYDGNTVTVKPSNTGEIVYNASKILTQTKTYEIKVKAIGNKNYADSSYSNIVKYTRKELLSAPSIKLNGDLLSWSTVDGAECYTIEVNYPNNFRSYLTYSTTGFDLSNVLHSPGVYTFRVKAGNQSDENDYSGEIKYTHKKQLSTPSNIVLNYDSKTGNSYMYMLIDENSYGFNLLVNNVKYTLIDQDLNTYSEKNGYLNAIEIKLSEFLESKGCLLDQNSGIELRVQAKSSLTDYFTDSEYSTVVNFNGREILQSPTVSLNKIDNYCELSWNKIDGATRYIVYKDFNYYCTIKNSSDTKILFSNSDIENVILTVSCEGGEYYYPSKMSNAVSYNLTDKAGTSTIVLQENRLEWEKLATAEKYFIEISNNSFYFSKLLNASECEIAENKCGFSLENIDYSVYDVRLTILESNKLPNIVETKINYTKKLDDIENAKIGDASSRYNIIFDKVEQSYGYIVHLANSDKSLDEDINIIFKSNKINLTPYITSSGLYEIKIKALAIPYSNMTDSDWVDLGSVKHAEKLKTPEPVVENIDGEYILKFNKVENAEKYRIMINYVDLYADGTTYNINGYNITNLLSSAQSYTIKVKAIAQEGQTEYYDSDYGETSINIYIQLNTINSEDISVNFDENNNSYILTFKTETHAAKYDIKIICETEDKITEDKFTITTVPYDITQKLMGAGVYRIYVMAKASNAEGYFYQDASESSYPYVFNKLKSTLNNVENIKIATKSETSSDLILSWDKVSGADLYYVNIYYKAPNGENIRTVAEETVCGEAIDLNNYISKEGRYTFKIRAVSNSVAYPSAFVEFPYEHLMTVKADYERNKIIYMGKSYSHYVSSYEQLKNLVYYYYLYENVYYPIGSGGESYNLKFRIKPSDDETPYIDKIIADSKLEIEGTTEYDKLSNLISYILGDLKETKGNLSYSLINGDGCYLLSCSSGFEWTKTLSIENTKGTKFDQKSVEVKEILKRSESYVFKLELGNKIDVSNSEQLFMAVQSNLAPNFVGDYQNAKNIYDNAKSVLRTICVDSMSDYKKVLAIYDWLINNVVYNYRFEEKLNSATSLTDTILLANGENVKLGDFKDEYLEGIFASSEKRMATSNGLAKAFVLMCRLEGISATKVNGTKDENNYYWNQVYLETPNSSEACWFNVDISASYALSTFNSVQYQIPTHKYFLVTNTFMINNLNVSQNGETANKTFNYSANTDFQYTITESTMEGDVTKTVSGKLKYQTGKVDDFMQDVINYLYYEASLGNWTVVEVDMSNTTTDLAGQIDKITGEYSTVAREMFGACNIGAELATREATNTTNKTILIYARPN